MVTPLSKIYVDKEKLCNYCTNHSNISSLDDSVGIYHDNYNGLLRHRAFESRCKNIDDDFKHNIYYCVDGGIDDDGYLMDINKLIKTSNVNSLSLYGKYYLATRFKSCGLFYTNGLCSLKDMYDIIREVY